MEISDFDDSYTNTKISETAMQTLQTNLLTIFLSRLVVGQVTEVVLPYMKYRMALKSEEGNNESKRLDSGSFQNADDDVNLTAALVERNSEIPDEMSVAEIELLMPEYNSTVEDYAEIAIQFGYVTLFVVAFSLTPLLAYVSNLVEIKMDGWKLFRIHRRAIPKQAEDIGAWQPIFYIVVVFAVWTNAGIFCFTENVLSNTISTADAGNSYHYRFYVMGLFVAIQWAIFIFMAITSVNEADIPEAVQIQLDRTQFIQDRLVDRIPEDSDGEDSDDDEA